MLIRSLYGAFLKCLIQIVDPYAALPPEVVEEQFCDSHTHVRSRAGHPPMSPLSLSGLSARPWKKTARCQYQHASDLRADLKRLKRDTDSGRLVSASVSGQTPAEATRQPRRWYFVVAGTLELLLIGSAVAWFARRGATPAPELEQHRLTTNTSDNPVIGAAISLDGRFLAYSDQDGIHIRVIETAKRIRFRWREFRPPRMPPCLRSRASRTRIDCCSTKERQDLTRAFGLSLLLGERPSNYGQSTARSLSPTAPTSLLPAVRIRGVIARSGWWVLVVKTLEKSLMVTTALGLIERSGLQTASESQTQSTTWFPISDGVPSRIAM